jgi:hypothetical protein
MDNVFQAQKFSYRPAKNLHAAWLVQLIFYEVVKDNKIDIKYINMLSDTKKAVSLNFEIVGKIDNALGKLSYAGKKAKSRQGFS